jgi:hypothetical protein
MLFRWVLVNNMYLACLQVLSSFKINYKQDELLRGILHKKDFQG